jgi:hypothetical protein
MRRVAFGEWQEATDENVHERFAALSDALDALELQEPGIGMAAADAMRDLIERLRAIDEPQEPEPRP